MGAVFNFEESTLVGIAELSFGLRMACRSPSNGNPILPTGDRGFSGSDTKDFGVKKSSASVASKTGVSAFTVFGFFFNGDLRFGFVDTLD